FVLGQTDNIDEIRALCSKYNNIQGADKAFKEVKEYWKKILGVIRVSTPDESMDNMLNGWLLYQTLACRMWARSALYQSGGAYGFRDQLQDSMALVYISPETTRNQILYHSSRQFFEGDVQHWWHPGTDKGIRTKFSDDLLWMPYVTIDYIRITGDYSILDMQTPYLDEECLKDEEDERYNRPCVSEVKASLYEHCIKAIEHSLKFGQHGIPLMGSGDWNDGMNTVGNKGRGESVWLGWFLYSILVEFSVICSHRKDSNRAERYMNIAKEIVKAVEDNAWDGNWYRRAYFDNGIPLGSAENTECRIDSLAQSWAVISGAGRKDRIKEAFEAVEHYLINKDDGIILLLTPPFDEGDLEPGYIKGYLPGVRENGGQYTHAAVWVVLAYAMQGMGDKAWEYYNMLNPINHAKTMMEVARYKVEPYVMAADVYAVNPHAGRGGWTWYTGAAGWMYRVGIQHILGFKIEDGKLSINPCIPKSWSEYSIEYLYKKTSYNIAVRNPSKVSTGIEKLIIDNIESKENYIKLTDDGKKHYIEVIMG
ncbi:MAG: GH36-type glycosyl hydrolase domain-containing protein, partial [Bacillota bacterium]